MQIKNQSRTAFLSTPKGITLVVLLAAAVLATGFGIGAAKAWINLGVSVGTAVLIDLIVALLQRRSRIFPDGAVLTGLVVGMVLSSGVSWAMTALTAAVAILSKHLLKIKRRPILNPAAFGLAMALLPFGTSQSWWGGFAELPVWSVGVLILMGLFITARVNKFPQVLSFLGTYFGLLLILGLAKASGVPPLFRPPFVNAALFLNFFMLTDPPTSPARYRDQVWFGCIAAVVSVVEHQIFHGLSFLLVGLLVANGWSAWRSVAKRAERKAA